MRNPKKEIMLVATAEGIMAHWLVGGNPDPDTVELFGSHILPTPWLRASSMQEAMAEIKQRNPGYAVSCV